MKKIDKLLNFMRLIGDFQKIERKVLVNGSHRDENDLEHSYSLAMLAWYFVSINNIEVDIDKVIKYALIHDLVEVYAGDTYFYTTDNSVVDSKKEREKNALERIKSEFPDLKDITDMISVYECKGDKESKLVYELDKIEPVMKIYMDKGRSWKRDNISLEMLSSRKLNIIPKDSVVREYLDELLDLLSKEKDIFTR